MIKNWSIIKIQHSLSDSINLDLKNKRFNIYNPKIKQSKSLSTVSLQAIFPGYMFVQMDFSDQNISAVTKSQGVYGFLTYDNAPAIIEDDFMAQLKSKINYINAEEGVWRMYQEGDKVLLESPALTAIGTVLDHTVANKSRVKILIDFMGREIKAEVDWFHLKPYNTNHHINKIKRRTRGKNRPIKIPHSY